MNTRARLPLSAIALLVLLAISAAPAVEAQYQTGDVITSDNSSSVILIVSPRQSRVAVYRQGQHVRNIRAYTQLHQPVLLAIDRARNVYTEENGFVIVTDPSGSSQQFTSQFGTHINASSGVFDRSGNLYMFYQTAKVAKIDPQGNTVDTYTLPDVISHEAIELAADQCTLFYTASMHLKVKRYNICTETALADFATLPQAVLPRKHYPGIRILPDGRVLVSNGTLTLHDANGTLIRTYVNPVQGAEEEGFEGIALDPSGVTFHVAGSEGSLFRFDLESGALASPTFKTGYDYVSGLVVVGEPRAAIDETAVPLLDPIALAALGALLALAGVVILRR